MKANIVRLLFQFQTEYKGSPFYITGNAFRHAISRQVNVSFGCFTNQKSLYRADSYQYETFFKIRAEKILSFKPFLLPHTQYFYSRAQNKRKHVTFFTPSAVTFDVINPPGDLIDYIKNQELLQFGGLRNEGFGVVELIDYVELDISNIVFPLHATHLTLLTPILYLPRFVEAYNCRQEQIIFWNNGSKNRLKVISARQFFRLKTMKSVKKIALNGILRKFLFGQFGFGEYIIHNWAKEGNN